MATIFRANDAQLGRDVAVKVLRSEYGRDPAFVARFRQEAQSAAALNHPNVVNVFDYGMESGDPFIVMELIDGGDLASVIHEHGPLDPVAAARIAQQIYEALDAAHARGIIHRDIKPTNVLLTSGGRVKVADFGIARAFSEAQLTMPGTTWAASTTSARNRRAVRWSRPPLTSIPPASSCSRCSLVDGAGRATLQVPLQWHGSRAIRRRRRQFAQVCPRSWTSPFDERWHARRPIARPPVTWPRFSALYSPNPQGAVWPPPRQPAGPIAAGAAAGAWPVQRPWSATGQPTVPQGVVYGRGGPPSQPPAAKPLAQEEEDDGGAGAWGWVAAALGVLVLFAGGGLLFLLLSGKPAGGPNASGLLIQVPSYVGLQLADARQNAQSQGFVLSVGAYQTTDQAPEGSVIAQDPAAGATALKGSAVTVTVATQKQTVPVPDLRLHTEADAFDVLAQNNLAPGERSEAYDPDVPANLVIRPTRARA